MIGKYHSKITSSGLSEKLNQEALSYVTKGNLDSDKAPRKSTKDYTDGYNIDAQHSNNTTLAETSAFLQDSTKIVVDDFIEALNSTNNKEELYQQAFYDFGRLTHSIQDFYSHTNWINQTDGEIIPWNEDSEEINLDNPENLTMTKYNQFSQFLEKINPIHKWLVSFSYDAYYNKGNKDFSHYTINKDKENTIADSLYKDNNNGKSAFELANKTATAHTEQKWKEVTSELQSNLNDKDYFKLLEEIDSFNSDIKYYDENYLNFRKNFNKDMKELNDN